jgi:acyl-CoA synthetase (AMP-forming)/AMP-acid ligase II
MPRTLVTDFLRSCENFGGYPAIEAEGQTTTYQQLANRAKSLSATVSKIAPSTEVPLTAVLGYRSQTAYAAVLASLFAGHGYVPLNPTFLNVTKFLARAWDG